MVKSLGLALLAAIWARARQARCMILERQFLEFKCQNTQTKAGVKFSACKAKCVSK